MKYNYIKKNYIRIIAIYLYFTLFDDSVHFLLQEKNAFPTEQVVSSHNDYSDDTANAG